MLVALILELGNSYEKKLSVCNSTCITKYTETFLYMQCTAGSCMKPKNNADNTSKARYPHPGCFIDNWDSKNVSALHSADTGETITAHTCTQVV